MLIKRFSLFFYNSQSSAFKHILSYWQLIITFYATMTSFHKVCYYLLYLYLRCQATIIRFSNDKGYSIHHLHATFNKPESSRSRRASFKEIWDKNRGQTDRQTDKTRYRVALRLKIKGTDISHISLCYDEVCVCKSTRAQALNNFLELWCVGGGGT